MAAAKSMLGHAETGAGAVGIARAALQLQLHQQLPLTHLRLLNPYVLNALEAEAKLLHQTDILTCELSSHFAASLHFVYQSPTLPPCRTGLSPV